jgi:glycosyltransferase involved in cell wall biosynthesis
MKLVFLSTRYMTGGASLNAVLLAKQMADRGHECEVWFLMKTGEIETFDIKTRLFSEVARLRIGDWLKILRLFYSELRHGKFDAAYSFYPLTNILGSFSKYFCGPKVFIASQRNPVQKQNRVLYWLEMLCGSTSLYDANIAVSHDVANSCSKHPKAYRKRLKVIHNGVPPLPRVEISKKECRNYFELSEETFLLGSIGRLDPQKNVQLLIEIMPKLPYAHLAIAGTGVLEADLKRRSKEFAIEDRVHFLGNLMTDDVAKLLKAIDIFTFPTLYEGFGRALVESFSVGTPVIASDIPVLREIAGQAVLFADDEPRSWIRAVNQLHDDPRLRDDLAAKGLSRTDNYGLKKMVDEYCALLETAV